ncbi:hypothetical protein POM88_038489 [Heracleum sosnowskyi]|uniref:Uncharacterized protein n=1 Tax=Heracleum sosnowskyi TaxID=360622 RepID=A0AAD8M8D6_9APIA|nr:hypothetical protein POM88_038489 [Heracleum sosnowskyi]
MSTADQGGNAELLEAPQCDKDSLYEKGRSIIWVIEIKGKLIGKNENTEERLTGFSLECDGSLVIITRAREFYFVNATSVRVRRFNGTFKTARMKSIDFKLDLAMLELDDGQVTNEYGELVLDGSLSACQHLIYIGNPGNYVGSSLVGRACFRCEDLSFDMNKYKACNEYKSRKNKHPLEHMVLGDLIQPVTSKEPFTRYDKELNAYVPIIQCDGFPFKRNSQGSPIFNLDGKIVGMLLFQFAGYYIAIHVSAIKAFLNSKPQVRVL